MNRIDQFRGDHFFLSNFYLCPVKLDPTGEERQRQRMRFEAAKDAMQGLLANPGGPVQANSHTGWSLTNCTADDVARAAVEIADALLAALEDTK